MLIISLSANIIAYRKQNKHTGSKTKHRSNATKTIFLAYLTNGLIF